MSNPVKDPFFAEVCATVPNAPVEPSASGPRVLLGDGARVTVCRVKDGGLGAALSIGYGRIELRCTAPNLTALLESIIAGGDEWAERWEAEAEQLMSEADTFSRQSRQMRAAVAALRAGLPKPTAASSDDDPTEATQ